MEELERRIHALEEQVTALHRDIDASREDYVRLQELAERLAAAEAELDESMERWLGLAEDS